MSTLTFKRPPQHVCLLRLSAIGDTCHAVAALRALQGAWPEARFTWVIGKLEAKLMTAILPDVEFITFDKNAMLGELRRLRATLKQRRFDILFDLQLSLRASWVSTMIRAQVKLGFDRRRARELQWLFTNARIEPVSCEHVLDSFLGFVRACGIEPGTPRWDIRLPESAMRFARSIVTDASPTLLISPCSSHELRNWPAERYAAVARYAYRTHAMRVVLVGGRTAFERRMGDAILACAANLHSGAGGNADIIDKIGQDTLPELLGLMSQSTALLSPDSGPAHMATMVGLPVLGLYAATRSARAGPYNSRQWCVDKYAEAALAYCGKTAAQLPWTTKIEKAGVMDLIDVSEVTAKLDSLLPPLR